MKDVPKNNWWVFGKGWWIVVLLIGGYSFCSETIQKTRQDGFDRGIKCSEGERRERTEDKMCINWWKENDPIGYEIEKQKRLEELMNSVEESKKENTNTQKE